jgi:2-polyprenyl-3-methyl-5-hydroxy-6-metoxy-1,4-benzoquinol methylase
MKSIEQTLKEKSVQDIESIMAKKTNIYQIYNCFSDPVVPNPNSLVHSKHKDLNYEKDDFNGMSVMDLGCSYGFFAFNALNLGASKVVGVDLREDYVNDLNKIAKSYGDQFPKYFNKIQFKLHKLEHLPYLAQLNEGVKPDILLVHSLIHWFFIARKDVTLEQIFDWMKDNCNKAVYFEGCVSAEEKVMADHGVEPSRLTEENFMELAKTNFFTTNPERMTYNQKRIRVKMYK